MKMDTIEITVLEPQDGYVLTNKPIFGADEAKEYSYSMKVYLGVNDAKENWREIPISEIPEGVVV